MGLSRRKEKLPARRTEGRAWGAGSPLSFTMSSPGTAWGPGGREGIDPTPASRGGGVWPWMPGPRLTVPEMFPPP